MYDLARFKDVVSNALIEGSFGRLVRWFTRHSTQISTNRGFQES